jgi:hypothetical protein
MANVPISAFTVPANTVGIGATGYSLTGSASASFMDLAGTWNTSGTPTAIKLNITDTASNAASLLMDLQTTVSGVTTSRFQVNKNGLVGIANSSWLQGGFAGGNIVAAVSSAGAETGAFLASVYYFRAAGSSVAWWDSTNQAFSLGTAASVCWTNNVAAPNGTIDLRLTRRGAANLRLGAADAATAVPQILSVQSVVATGANQAGADFTITGSQGRGSGAGGSIIFQVAPAGTSGSGLQNALATALTIASTNTATFAGVIVASSGLSSAANILLTTNGGQLFFGASNDLVLARDAANTLALKNGANAQEFRVYETTTGTIYKAILGNRGLMKISGAAFADGAGAQAGTLTNAPAVGNPTKWISIDDNGTTRYIPAW